MTEEEKKELVDYVKTCQDIRWEVVQAPDPMLILAFEVKKLRETMAIMDCTLHNSLHDLRNR